VTAAGAGLWARLCAETVLATTLLVTADVWMPRPSMQLSFAIAIGATAGVTLVFLLAGRRPVRGSIVRERRRLVAAKGGVLAIGSASEEVVWRWFAIGALTPRVGVLAAFAASTLAFALAHGRPRAVVVHIVTGCTFGGVYVLTGSLVAAIVSHVAYNLAVLLAVETGRALRPA
jgi:membrane protease YdiL (CAAX protease family)